jgi:hypothetical protein
MIWERRRRDSEIQLRAKGNGACDALDGFPRDWLPFTFLDERDKDPHTITLVLEDYEEGYLEGSKPLPF